MAEKLAIIGASGKIGGATFNALPSNNLLPASQIVALTSAQSGDAKWTQLSSAGVEVRHATFDDRSSMEKALQGISRLFLVSSPRIKLDYNDAPEGQGREKDHYVAIDAARKNGVKQIYYTSLAFSNPSKSRVMKAHERTEAYLASLTDIKYTVLREGLYNESWPLYLGHYDLKGDERSEIVVAGDGPISWTAIPDLGLATALILAAPAEEYAGKTVYLSQTREPKTLKDVAGTVSKATGREIALKVAPRSEHEEHHINDRGLDEGHIRWWAKTYDAVVDGECNITHDATLEDLLKTKGRTPKPMEETVREMLGVS